MYLQEYGTRDRRAQDFFGGRGGEGEGRGGRTKRAPGRKRPVPVPPLPLPLVKIFKFFGYDFKKLKN